MHLASKIHYAEFVSSSVVVRIMCALIQKLMQGSVALAVNRVGTSCSLHSHSI